jgi:hypothetical protein
MYKAEFDVFDDFFQNIVLGWFQGKPIGMLLWGGLSFVGSHLGGLHMIYAIGMLIILINSILSFQIINITFNNKLLGLLVVSIYILYPSDTMRFWICETFHLQTSYAFMLLALLFFAKKKPFPAYLLSILPLLTYETAFFPLFVVPLLFLDWQFNRKFLRKTITHILIISFIFIGYLIARHFLETNSRLESVINSSNTVDLLSKWVAMIFTAPLASLFSFFIRPFFAFTGGLLSFIVIPIVALLSYFVLRLHLKQLVPNTSGKSSKSTFTNHLFQATFIDLNNYKKYYKLIFIGILAVIIPYIPLIKHFPPLLWAMQSRVHMASALGWSFIVGGVFYIFLIHGKKNNIKYKLLFISVYFALLSGFWVGVQQEFAESWSIQKKLTKQILDLNPEVQKNTNIFLVGDIQRPKFMSVHTYTWGTSIALQQLFTLPEEWSAWDSIPKIFTFPSEKDLQINKEGKLEWFMPAGNWNAKWQLWNDNCIVINISQQGATIPDHYTITVNNTTLDFKNNVSVKNGININSFEKKKMWEILE